MSGKARIVMFDGGGEQVDGRSAFILGVVGDGKRLFVLEGTGSDLIFSFSKKVDRPGI